MSGKFVALGVRCAQGDMVFPYQRLLKLLGFRPNEVNELSFTGGAGTRFQERFLKTEMFFLEHADHFRWTILTAHEDCSGDGNLAGLIDVWNTVVKALKDNHLQIPVFPFWFYLEPNQKNNWLIKFVFPADNQALLKDLIVAIVSIYEDKNRSIRRSSLLAKLQKMGVPESDAEETLGTLLDTGWFEVPRRGGKPSILHLAHHIMT